MERGEARYAPSLARMAELADAQDLGSWVPRDVRVRVSLRAPSIAARPPPMSAESPEVRIEAREEGPVARRLEVTVAPGRVRRAFERAYRDLARGARVKGFRPGKVPRSVLERLYGGSVAEQLEDALVAETLPGALEE